MIIIIIIIIIILYNREKKKKRDIIKHYIIRTLKTKIIKLKKEYI